MGFANVFFLGARISQGVLGLAAAACGFYINHVLKQFAADATTVESDADHIIGNSEDGVIIEKIIKSFLDAFEGAPTRGYVLISVSIWSILAVIYLLVAQYTTKHPRMNKRSFRVPLEVITVVLWLGGFIAIASLAVEYEAVCSPLDAFEEFPIVIDLLSQIPIISDLLTTATVGVAASVAAGLCWFLWVITSFAACCMDRKGRCCGRRSKKTKDPESATEESGFMSMQQFDATPNPGFAPSESPNTPRANNLVPGQNVYTPLQQEYSYFSPSNVTSPVYNAAGYGQQARYEQQTIARSAPVGTVKRKQLPQALTAAVPWRSSVPRYPSQPPQGYHPAPQFGYNASPTNNWNR